MNGFNIEFSERQQKFHISFIRRQSSGGVRKRGVPCVKSEQIRSFSGQCFPVFIPNTGKYGPEKLRIWTLFTQWFLKKGVLETVCSELKVGDLL